MTYTTNTKTTWFAKIRDSLLGLETTMRDDGSYDGDYQMLKSVWLVERNGEQKHYSEFGDLWKELSPSPEDIGVALAKPESDFLYLLHCGLGCGRPISRHTLWDQCDFVADYRDPVIKDDVLVFYIYECSDIFDSSPHWRRIARIRFSIADGSFTREHVVDLNSRR